MNLANLRYVYIAEGSNLFVQDIEDLSSVEVGTFTIVDEMMFLELFPNSTVLLPVLVPSVMSLILGKNIKCIHIGEAD